MNSFNAAILFLRDHSVLPMVIVFGLIAVATYWPGRRKAIESHGEIPFRDEA